MSVTNVNLSINAKLPKGSRKDLKAYFSQKVRGLDRNSQKGVESYTADWVAQLFSSPRMKLPKGSRKSTVSS